MTGEKHKEISILKSQRFENLTFQGKSWCFFSFRSLITLRVVPPKATKLRCEKMMGEWWFLLIFVSHHVCQIANNPPFKMAQGECVAFVRFSSFKFSQINMHLYIFRIFLQTFVDFPPIFVTFALFLSDFCTFLCIFP